MHRTVGAVGRGRRILSGLVIGLAAMAVVATSAGAAQRYAAQTGLNTNPCTSALPCDLSTAVNSAAANDEIIVNPGTFTVGATGLTIPAGASLHGVAGQSKPLIVSDANVAVSAAANTRLTDLRVVQSSAGSVALSIGGAGTVGERLEVSSASLSSCQISTSALLRDSICVNTRAAGSGVALTNNVLAGGNDTSSVRNVTAVATGPSSFGVKVSSGGTNRSMDLRNVIATGTSLDVSAFAGASMMTVTLAFSNWTTSTPSGAGVFITPAGSATNQSSLPPLFVNAAAGDYRQASGSPTIDSGGADATTGTTDFEGQARTLGTSMDIGADEFTPAVQAAPPPAPAADTTKPQTSIDKGPKKKSKVTKATFAFSADESGVTFECRLDEGGFKACTSPQRYKRLKKGKHKFAVRAKDAAGNVDASPAILKWMVKKKPKR